MFVPWGKYSSHLRGSALRVKAVDSAPILFKLQFCFTSVHMCLVLSDFLPWLLVVLFPISVDALM